MVNVKYIVVSIIGCTNGQKPAFICACNTLQIAERICKSMNTEVGWAGKPCTRYQFMPIEVFNRLD